MTTMTSTNTFYDLYQKTIWITQHQFYSKTQSLIVTFTYHKTVFLPYLNEVFISYGKVKEKSAGRVLISRAQVHRWLDHLSVPYMAHEMPDLQLHFQQQSTTDPLITWYQIIQLGDRVTKE